MFTDNHCMRLVRDGVTDKLLSLLKEPEVPPTLQHAVFSALRNMGNTKYVTRTRSISFLGINGSLKD